jgi:hypothetical protein
VVAVGRTQFVATFGSLGFKLAGCTLLLFCPRTNEDIFLSSMAAILTKILKHFVVFWLLALYDDLNWSFCVEGEESICTYLIEKKVRRKH